MHTYSIAAGRPKKPRTKWLGIFSNFSSKDELGADMGLLWALAKVIDRSPDWRTWWLPAEVPRLELWPLVYEMGFSLQHGGRSLIAQQGFPELDSSLAVFDSAPNGCWEHGWAVQNKDSILKAVRETEAAIHSLLGSVSEQLSLGPTPRPDWHFELS